MAKSEAGKYSSEEFLKEHGEKGTKFSYRDRKTVVIVSPDQRHYKEGKEYSMFALKADKLISLGIAKEVKK